MFAFSRELFDYILVVHWVLILAASANTVPGQACDRPCKDATLSMTCEFNFTLEWYATMSKACYECPRVEADCFRPHCIAGDGFPRAVTVVNRQLPGPAIAVCKGDTVLVHVRNFLDNEEGTAIHWHGIYQNGTQWMDGVPMLTQCPIPAKTTFTYKFKANPSGTHWWHAHAGFQRVDGVAGALVVRTREGENPHANLYDVDSTNHTMMVGDWLHQTTMTKYVLHHHSSGNNKGESMLINGRGRSEDSTCDGKPSSTPFEKFLVESGMKYRFRVISNAGVFCPFELSVDGHVLTIIATDGIDVEPFKVTSVVVHGGERFDFVLNANHNATSYWIRTQGMADCRNQSQKAILRYVNTPNTSPLTSPLTSTVQLNPLNKRDSAENVYISNLKTVDVFDTRLYNKPDAVHFLGFDFKKVDNPVYHDPAYYPIRLVSRNNHLYSPQINNISWKSPSSPLLTQPGDVDDTYFCNLDEPSGNRFRSCTHVYDVKVGDLVELIVFDEGFTFDAGHPMHLHGQHFAVVAMGKVGNNLTTAAMRNLHQSGGIKYNFDRPVMKDTVIIPDGGYAVLRFLAENPGVWAFHCHLSFHLEAGMMVSFRVGDQNAVKGIPPNFPKCGDWSPSGSRASGNLRISFMILETSALLSLCFFLFYN